MFADEVTRRVFTAYERGDLITMCGWCRRLELDGEWVVAPRAALTAIDSRYSLSHSICPACSARLTPESRRLTEAARHSATHR
jgi:hypothetical protein